MCLQHMTKPKCCGGLSDDGDEKKKSSLLSKMFRRETLALVASIALSVCLIVSVATPWYSIEGYGLLPPQDTVTVIFYWTGMEALFVPPVNGHRTLSLNWEDMNSRMVKDVYFSAVSMGILAFVFNNVMLVAIIFGLGCHGTSKLLNKITCGMFKWIVVMLALFTMALCVLSWAIFMLINNALESADLCAGATPYFPVNYNTTGNATVPSNCGGGYWCIAFGGTAKLGLTRFAWGPSIGWVSAVIATAPAFLIFCIALTVDQHRFDYERIGRPKRTKKSKSRAAASKGTKMSSRNYDPLSDEEEERRPLRSGGHRESGRAQSHYDVVREESRDRSSSKKSSSKIGGKASKSSSKKASQDTDGFRRVSLDSDSSHTRSSRSRARRK